MTDHGQRPGALIGRAREVTALEQALDRLASGGRWVLQLVGEPGIGKSRLAAELASRAEQRGHLVLDGRAAEFERDIPFGVVVDALNDYLGALGPQFLRPLGEPAIEELASIFPSLSEFADPAAAQRVPSERHRTHYAIRAALERVAAQQPVVLLLDDVHWADEASVELIGHLVRRFGGPLLAAFAFRRAPHRLVSALDAAERSGFGMRLDLRPLSPDEADALLDPRHDGATRAALYRESGGNPFYLEELERATSRPDRVGAVRAAVAQPAGDGPAPPASVAAAIRDELAALTPDARTVLDAAAVAGGAFDLDLVATIAGRPEPVALTALDQLLDAELLRPTDAPRRFRFRHPIVRRTVYETMPRGWRLGAHARAAAALEAAGGPLAARAHHVERSAASGDEEAIALLRRAARSAALRAPLTAGHWLATAVRLLPAGTDADRQLALLGEAAAVLSQAGAYEEALGLLERALGLLPPERVRARAELIAQIAVAKRQTGHPVSSRSLLEEALASLEDPDGGEALLLRAELVLARYFSGDFAAMEAQAAAMLDTVRALGDDRLVGLVGALASVAASARADTPAAEAALDEAQAAFDGLTDEALTADVDLCGWIGLAALRLERVDDALRSTRRGLRLARETGKGSVLHGQLGLEAQALLLQGRVTDAVAVAEAATDAALAGGNDQLLVWSLQTAATAAMWAGDVDRALFSAREAAALADRLGEGYFPPLAHLVLAGALLAAGDAAGARGELDGLDPDRAAPLLDLSAARGWELLALTHLELGDVDAADAAVARAEARAAAGGLDQQTAAALRGRSAVLLARGEPAAAGAAAADAVRRAERAGNPLAAARARALCGRSAAARGDRERATAELARARETLLECGARREADAVARELRRLGHRIRRVAPVDVGAGLGGLSLREREVAEQVAAGHSNRGIAGALFLSEKTIESHLGRIYGKLGVHSRVALAALVERDRARDPSA